MISQSLLPLKPFEEEEGVDAERPQRKKNDEGDHISAIQNHAGKEGPTTAASGYEAECNQEYDPRRAQSVQRERIKVTKRPTVKGEEVNRANADENVEPHREKAGAECRQTRGPEEKFASLRLSASRSERRRSSSALYS